jgi:hypothetical protein
MSSQVAVRQELAVVDIPEGEGTGLEGIDASDQIVPRLQIAAGTSKQVIEGSDVYIEGLRQGEIFNTVTGEIYGKEVFVVPLWYSRNRILFNKEWKQECKSNNAIDGGVLSPEGCDKCEYSQWGTGKDGKGFACTEFRNFAVAILQGGAVSLASISFKSSGTPVAKKWISLIETRKVKTTTGKVTQLPMYMGLYKYSRATQQGKETIYYVPTIDNAGMVDEADVAALRKFHERFKSAGLSISSTEGTPNE